ncbi:MAG: HlyC/CorC family transporter [Sandaracinus sp.]|nr:HlyC/CorC family transporter [Sandaracinus sp.]MCB9615521.1 HlyC/CorC family transporter [Sandaracinus sp.]MCB9619956.1 HlyC/CorC family transporter [Sandaracinus sp.]MCB9636283.1 HlyC/CorC family transporter [Sandaracinus sp.]
MLAFTVLAALVAINALYVAAEFASVSVPRSKIAQAAKDGSSRAAGLRVVLDDAVALDRYIAACQIGITLSSLLVGAYGQATLGPALAELLETHLGLESVAAVSTSAVVVILLLTALQVVLGELVPKNLALRFPTEVALFTYPPTRLSTVLYRPFIAFLNGSGLLLLKPFGLEAHGHQHIHGPEEIELLLAESRRGGALSPEAHRRLRRGLQLSRRTVHELMVPRRELEAIEVSTPTDEVVERLRTSPYSRLPVYRGSLDAVLGVVSSKDLVHLFVSEGELPPLESLVRPLPFVPETMTADRLVHYLQERRASLAIVVDEYGGVQGLISVEDVLAELLGDLADELKEPDPGPETLADGSVRLPGTMTLLDAEPWLGVRWTGATTTVGGHVVETLGRLPEAGEEHVIDGVRVKVLDMGPTAIRWLAVRRVEGER